MRFNPPPNWPVQPGWTPTPGWRPPTAWGEPPYGWQLWLADDPEHTAPLRVPASLPAGAPAFPREGVSTPPTEADPQRPAPRNDDDPAAPKKRLWAKAAENPIWTTLGALVGIVGLVVSMVQIYQAMQTPPVDLEVAALTIDSQQSIQGAVTGDGVEGTRSIEVTPIDLTLQNKGGEPSLITRIDAEVVYFHQLDDCTGAPPSPDTIAANYHLAIPMNDIEPTDEQLSNEVRFEVKPGTADRMVLTLGPQTQPAFETTPMVMSAKIKLIHDGDEVMDVGGVSVVTTVAAATAQIDALGSSPSPEARMCAKQNLEYLDEMFAIQATRSRVLDTLRSAYQRASA